MCCIENKQVLLFIYAYYVYILKYRLLCIFSYLKTLVQGRLQQMDRFFSVCIQTPIDCLTVFKYSNQPNV